MKIKINCPSCKKSFEGLPDLNRHISLRGCNGGIGISAKEFMKSIGISIKYHTT